MSPRSHLTSQLITLQAKWYLKLKEEGFIDIEDSKGNLKQHNIRTIAYQNRDVIQEFFTDLGHYLETHWDIPDLHRKILELYCRGMHIKIIGEKVNRTSRTVYDILEIYKRKIFKRV
jgi:hypothetical protein